MQKVAVVTVTYGERWKFLLQTIESVLQDPHCEKIVIVDNASLQGDHIEKFAKENGDKIIIIRNEQNVGSAGGFHQGLAKAREIDCDFVLILDDDNVLEENGIEIFLKTLDSFPDRESIALAGRRVSTDVGLSVFENPPYVSKHVPTSFFNVFGLSKLKNLFHNLGNKERVVLKREFHPIVEVESFAFGGSFLPMEAVRKAVLPQSKLFLYGDDIEYSWNIREAGYRLYACDRPFIKDVDATFQEGESHLTGLFSQETSDFKVYFRVRNMVLISMQRTRGFLRKSWLVVNIVIWFTGLFLIGLIKVPKNREFIRKGGLILRAVWNGLRQKTALPQDLKLPGNPHVL